MGRIGAPGAMRIPVCVRAKIGWEASKEWHAGDGALRSVTHILIARFVLGVQSNSQANAAIANGLADPQRQRQRPRS